MILKHGTKNQLSGTILWNNHRFSLKHNQCDLDLSLTSTGMFL